MKPIVCALGSIFAFCSAANAVPMRPAELFECQALQAPVQHFPENRAFAKLVAKGYLSEKAARQEFPESISNLLLKTVTNHRLLQFGPGIEKYAAKASKPLLYLPTIRINTSDLNYSNLGGRASQKSALRDSLDTIPHVNPHFLPVDVLLGSQMDAGGSGSIAKLAWLGDGKPVALKGPYSQKNKSLESRPEHLVEDYAALRHLYDMGHTTTHGIHEDENNEFWLVMDIAPGDRPHHPTVRQWINLQTVKDLMHIFQDIENRGGYVGGNFQYHITREGGIHLLDVAWIDIFREHAVLFDLLNLVSMAMPAVQRDICLYLASDHAPLFRKFSNELRQFSGGPEVPRLRRLVEEVPSLLRVSA